MSTHPQRLAARTLQQHPATLDALPPDVRRSVTGALSRLLVEMLDVTLCVRHAHWNARGPDFLIIFELLEDVGGRLDAQANRVAMRIRALGGAAPGTAQAIATESSFKPYPVEIASGQDHLEALALRLGLLSAEARLSIHECSGLGDPVTASLLAKVNAVVDHALWTIESHIAGSR